jgi:hypothetical protein
MNQSEIEEDIKIGIKTMSRGLMQKNYPIAFQGYKKLYEIGQPVVPHIQELLLSINWEKSKKYTELSVYTMGLFSLARDISESDSTIISKHLFQNGCPQHIKALINSKCRFLKEDYKIYKIGEVEVLEHKEIKSKGSIASHIENWLNNVPPKDLNGISRLYIVNKNNIENAQGTYMPELFTIALLWNNPFKEGSLGFKMYCTVFESTLYHEIGHHAYRHKFGVDSDQEKEADRYSSKIMKKKHPFMHIVSIIFRLLGLKSKRNYYRWGL